MFILYLNFKKKKKIEKRKCKLKASKSVAIKQMQPTAGGSSSSSGGGGGGVGGRGELSRGGLARLRSAPASWIDALLEEELEDPLKPNQCLTQLLSSGDPVSVTAGLSLSQSQLDQVGFQRQNSSPADLFDGYFSNYATPSSYDYVDVSPNSNKRAREDNNTQFPSPTAKLNFHSHLVNKHFVIIFFNIVMHSSYYWFALQPFYVTFSTCFVFLLFFKSIKSQKLYIIMYRCFYLFQL